MEYNKITNNKTHLSEAVFKNNNVDETHVMIEVNDSDCFENQLELLLEALESYMGNRDIPKESLVFTRFFVSDFANQESILTTMKKWTGNGIQHCALSVVQQPPLNDTKVVLWAYIINDKNQKTQKNLGKENELVVKRNGYTHVWSTLLTSDYKTLTSYNQTFGVFETLDKSLEDKGMNIKDNCIRTWLFVKDVDFNYEGVVRSRSSFFDKLDMNIDSHFIASTGIEGRHANPNVNVLMDAYSVGGIAEEQVKFLVAPTHLNPTHEYGVTFERGTSVDYGDRRHIFISGTASIDNKGEIVHTHNVSAQIERAILNVEALLKDADATMEDVSQLIIYLRDVADKKVISNYFESNFTDIPKVMVLAPVCRPGWLIEVECMAIKKIENKALKNF
ncbi:MAG: hypothetical protein JKY08_05310 [Flavobacteriaceae bacterium]|nr:hypothetical protein [Flavobacteriaceae bacterium]